jgi:cysteinyl-tRNA synthetase
MSRREEEFVPQKGNEVSFYACGPTVYNYPHIGNLRAFVAVDLMHRWLVYRGYHVKLVMNLTDVDDKTIKGSRKEGVSLSDFTARYKKAFFDDLAALNVKPAWMNPSATENIPEMVDYVKRLIEKGYAYETEDGVYFQISKFAGYGKLVHLDHDSLRAGASGRLANDEYDKENVADFALWKKWVPADGDVKWDAPFGAGRPGWHIECSVMSQKYLGETLDIHAGGIDLAFPHHTNEIAQSEAQTGKPFSRYWLHVTHLMVDGEKMSKSKGNFYTLHDLAAKGIGPRSVRFALLSAHYRKPLNFTFDLLTQADSSLKRIDEFAFFLSNVKKPGRNDALSGIVDLRRSEFEAAMDADLNASAALGALFETIREFYELRDEVCETNAKEALDFLAAADTVLGFIMTEKRDELSAEEASLLEERNSAKKAKDFAKADVARARLLEKGIEVRDTKDGAVWKRIG